MCIELHSALGTRITELTYCYYDTSDCQVRLILIITVQKTSQEVTEACSITEIVIARIEINADFRITHVENQITNIFHIREVKKYFVSTIVGSNGCTHLCYDFMLIHKPVII